MSREVGRFNQWLVRWKRRSARVAKTAFWPFGNVVPRKITDAQRASAIASLETPQLKALNAESAGLAHFLLSENRRISDYKLAAVRNLEKKATNQIAAAAAIVALITAFGESLPWWARAFPIALLVIAIFAYVTASYIKRTALPSFGAYVHPEILGEPLNEVRLASLAADAWSDYGRDLEAVNTQKANYVRTGNFWLLAALVSILVTTIVLAFLGNAGHGNAAAKAITSKGASSDVRQGKAAPVK